MAIGSGLSGSFGYSKESSYATRVAPAKFLRHRSCEFAPEYNRVQGEGIQSGALGLRSDQVVQTHQRGTGSVEFDVVTLNMVQLMEHLMGSSSSAQQGGTAAYLHTFTLADNYGKNLTLQQNVALRTGTNQCKELLSAKATSATFSVGVGEILTAQMEFDAFKYDTGQTLASPSYVSGVPFHFGQANLKLGSYGAEAAVTGVRAFSCTINRNMDTEAFAFNVASGGHNEPVLNAPTEITGTVEVDYLITGDFESRVTNMTFPSLVFECVSTTVIASTYYPTFRITLPGVLFDGAQNNAGYDAPRNQWGFTWKYDGTNLPTIQVMSTETSV